MMKYRFLLALWLFGISIVQAQVTGGRYAMSFLRMPNAPHISALGGINVSNPERDISFALQNPSLMRPGLHNQIGLSYNNYYAGIKIMNLNYGYHAPKINTSFALGVQYFNYGDFLQTDMFGNTLGNFKATDYALTLAASRSYKERWRYGASIKYAHSSFNDRTAAAILADVGVVYYDTAHLLTIGAVAKNIGFMVARYNPQQSAEPMPFDLQLGISKQFAHIPLRLMATIHHLYEWDIRYNNPADVETGKLFGTTDTNAAPKSYFADKLFRHFIFNAELTLAKRLTVIVGYNHLRRSELALKDRMALSGFSFGASLWLNKVQVHYARSYYHLAGAYNEFGFNFAMNKLLHLGNGGNRIGWNNDYPEW